MSKATTLQGKLLSPAGFGLVLLCFFLPFVAVACGPADNQMTASFTGIAMVSGSRPEITGTGLTADDVATIHALVEDQYDLEPLALVSALVVLAGMACALLRRARSRNLTGISLALAAMVLLIGAELRAIYRLEHVRGSEIVGLDALPDPGVAGTRVGFWVALAVLLVLAVGHGVALVRAPVATPPPDEPGPPDDPVGPDEVGLLDEAGFRDDPPERV